MRLYLDNCCFNRPFDDQSQIKIRLETEAKLKIQEEIISGTFQLIWSYILDYENNRNPYQERKLRIKKWKRYAIEDVEENPVVIETAKILNKKGFHKIDSLHIACAIISKSEYFLTTDDQILKRARLLNDIKINDPIGFIKEILS
ncbi:MAG: PIN domain-containing protein [Deltaproteobacteria bacterium]|nr:PIN domain-containing protein [Deltaproteobacteria bacterium]PXF50341.1 MAG: PIN domain protein [Deltaproteobacteria bacterium]